MMLHVDARGDTCPIPVVKAKKAIAQLQGAGQVEVLVSEEIAVQNLTKLAQQKGYGVTSQKRDEHSFVVCITVGDGQDTPAQEEAPACIPDRRQGGVVVVIDSQEMGRGSEELGKTLMKGFIYALTQQDQLPQTMLFYNGGAHLTCEGSPALEDLRTLEAEGVNILTCGTCLNFHGIADTLAVGGVTNMYEIAEKMVTAGHIVKP